MVVARRHIGHERAEQVKRGAVGQFLNHPDVVADLVGRDMPRPLDHPLHPGGERPLRQVPKRQVLSRLGETGGVHERTGAHSVAEAYDHVVLGKDLEQVVVLGIERVLFAGRSHHSDVEGPAPGDDAHRPGIGLKRSERVAVHAAVQG